MEIFNFEVLDSTNKKAKEIINEIKGDFVVSAKKQTEGKGRFGRIWISATGGAWFSIVVRDIIDKPQLLSFCASLSVCDILTRLNINGLNLKWPNDVYVDNKKICGVLLESIYSDNFEVIVGIGVNVNNGIDDISDIAVSTKMLTDSEIDVNELIKDIVKRFEHYLDQLRADSKQIISAWKENCISIGKIVNISTMNGLVEGEFIDIDESGFMIIKKDDQLIKIKEGDLA